MEFELEELLGLLVPSEEEFDDLVKYTSDTAYNLYLSKLSKFTKHVSELLGNINGLLKKKVIYGDIFSAFEGYYDFHDLIMPAKEFSLFLEFSYLLNKTIADRLFSGFEPNNTAMVSSSESAVVRVKEGLPYIPEPHIKQRLESALGLDVSELEKRKDSFFEKPAVKILINGISETLEDLTKTIINIDFCNNDNKKDYINSHLIPEASRALSIIDGLRMSSDMYSSLPELISAYPDFVFLTNDTDVEDSTETAKKLSSLFQYSLKIISHYKKQIEEKSGKQIIYDSPSLIYAEEIGPSPLRRRILSAVEIPKEFEDLLGKTYENVKTRNIRTYLLFHGNDFFLDNESKLKYIADTRNKSITQPNKLKNLETFKKLKEKYKK